MTQRIIGIDPSGSNCGIVVLDDRHIVAAYDCSTDKFYDIITPWLLHSNLIVVIEDIAAYSLRLMPAVIDTCKFIGELTYRLKNDVGVNVQLIPRSSVKKWVFELFPVMCSEFVAKKIEKTGLFACDVATKEEIRVSKDGSGTPWKKRTGNFFYLDDVIIQEAMRVFYRIDSPGKGRKYSNGMKKHNWQALSTATFFMTSI